MDKINAKLNKYRNKLINATDSDKMEIYNLKMQQYMIMQKKLMKQGGNIFALNSLNKMTDATINSMSSAKNVYSSEAVDKYLTDVLGDIKNAASAMSELQDENTDMTKQIVKTHREAIKNIISKPFTGSPEFAEAARTLKPTESALVKYYTNEIKSVIQSPSDEQVAQLVSELSLFEKEILSEIAKSLGDNVPPEAIRKALCVNCEGQETEPSKEVPAASGETDPSKIPAATAETDPSKEVPVAETDPSKIPTVTAETDPSKEAPKGSDESILTETAAPGSMPAENPFEKAIVEAKKKEESSKPSENPFAAAIAASKLKAKIQEKPDQQKSQCATQFPHVFDMLKTGKLLTGQDMTSIKDEVELNSFLGAVDFVNNENHMNRTILGHTIKSILKSCHPDKNVGFEEEVSNVAKVLNHLKDLEVPASYKDRASFTQAPAAGETTQVPAAGETTQVPAAAETTQVPAAAETSEKTYRMIQDGEVLPEGWVKNADKDNYVYYTNANENKTQWNSPSLPPLIEGWYEMHDPSENKSYFYNSGTQVSQWERPSLPALQAGGFLKFFQSQTPLPPAPKVARPPLPPPAYQSGGYRQRNSRRLQEKQRIEKLKQIFKHGNIEIISSTEYDI